MPTFDVTQYHTYADRFDVTADSAQEAAALIEAWYGAYYGDVGPTHRHSPDADVAPSLRPSLSDPNWRPPLYDADVQPRVQPYEIQAYVDVDGMRIVDADDTEYDVN